MNGKTSTVEAISATDLLRGDHRRIKELFRDFESVDRETKNYIARTAIEEIELHTLLEEKLFYPAVEREVEGCEEILSDSREAHHIAKLIIAELKVIPFGDRYHAKFEKLADTVTDHVDEEEDKLFPMAEKSDLDLHQLGLEMAHLKMRAVAHRPYLRERFRGAGKTAAFIALGTVVLAGLGWLAASRREELVGR